MKAAREKARARAVLPEGDDVRRALRRAGGSGGSGGLCLLLRTSLCGKFVTGALQRRTVGSNCQRAVNVHAARGESGETTGIERPMRPTDSSLLTTDFR